MSKLKADLLYSALWSAADEMRKIMSADVYKDYLLGLVFYKSLSDKTLMFVADTLEAPEGTTTEEAQKLYEEAKSSEDWEDLKDEIKQHLGCVIEPEHTFNAFYNQINDNSFFLSHLNEAFRNVEQSQGKTYDGLFDDFDTDSKDLGRTLEERNKLISSLIKALYVINFNDYEDDALGDAYEYLIAQFAAESGKKAGEFYTPKMVSTLIAKIVTTGREKKDGFSIYDPCMGSGSLLLQAKRFIYKSADGKEDYTGHIQYFGQELKNQTYNLCRMNMMLHRVPGDNQHLHNGDTLGKDWPVDEPTSFDATCMNPPYSQKWEPVKSLLSDPRFAHYEKLAPKSAADYAFLLHGFYHLKTDGTMGIVLPHGVLFRGGAEGVIRKHLLEDGSFYAVIGLPSNLFYSTGIPTCVIILKKNNINRDVLFIDASKDFVKEKARNLLTDEIIEKIFRTYTERKDVEKYAHLATFDEIKANDFNLNIPRYVDTFEKEPDIDLNETFKSYTEAVKQEKATDAQLNRYFKELGLDLVLGADK